MPVYACEWRVVLTKYDATWPHRVCVYVYMVCVLCMRVCVRGTKNNEVEKNNNKNSIQQC